MHAAASSPSSGAIPQLPDGSVLVVEDDRDLADGLIQFLEDEGLHGVSAANGREALDLLAKGGRPAVILTDLMMPEMDGWTFLDLLAKDPSLSGIPTIVITAAPHAQKTRLLKRPVFVKPLNLDSLLRAIRVHALPKP